MRRAPSAAPLPGPIAAVLATPSLLVQAAWLADPARRAGPLAIGPAAGRLLAVCPAAAERGVRMGQQRAQARLVCPDLAFALPDHDMALLLADRLLGALLACSPVVEAADPAGGLAYLDAHGLERLYSDLGDLGRAVLDAAVSAGLTVRVGMGESRLVARALVGRSGEGEVPIVLGAEGRAFLASLPLADPGLALPERTAATLAEVGIPTVGALADLPQAGLALRFGPDVLAVARAARGEPEPPLGPWTVPARIRREHHDEDGLADRAVLAAILTRLTEQVAGRLAARAQAARTLRLELHGADSALTLRQRRAWPPLSRPAALRQVVLDLLAVCEPTAPITALSLEAADLTLPDPHQPTLLGEEAGSRRRERLAAVLASEARRCDQPLLVRYRPDQTSEDGWRREAGTLPR